MKDLYLRLLAVARRLPVEWYLGAAVFALMLARLGAAWSSEMMPMGDWPGHEAASLEMVKCLQGGHWDCYVGSQFGGMPLFQMYAPLFFVVSAALHLATGQLVPLFLIMRGLAFLGVFAVAPALWYFTRMYLGRDAARWALAISPLHIFYPSAVAIMGIGASGAFTVGLVPSVFAVPLVLVLLGTMRSLASDRPHRGAWWLMVAAAAVLALTHTMGLFFGAILAAASFAAVLAFGGRVRPLVSAGLAAFGLVAFWLVPFATYSGITPGVAIVDPMGASWLNAFLPVGVVMGWPLVAFMTVTTLGGLWLLVRQHAWPLLTLVGGAVAFHVLRHPINHVLPDLALHYFRFGVFVHLLELTVASVALAWTWQRAKAHGVRTGHYVIAGVAIFVLMGVFLFDAKRQSVNDSEVVMDNDIAWSIDGLPGAAVAKDVTAAALTAGLTGRTFVESPTMVSSYLFGSVHYLEARLQHEAGLDNITGLYVQASTLSPFAYSAVSELSAGKIGYWAGEFIRFIRPFRSQSPAVFLGRLADLGVESEVLISPEKIEAVRATGLQDEVASSPEFAIFRARSHRPLISTAQHRPLVFAAAYGRVKFRELALALYAGEHTYDTLVVEEKRPVAAWAAEAARFSGIIVDAEGLDDRTLVSLRALGLPVIVLNAGSSVATNDYTIPRFEPMTQTTHLEGSSWPVGWEQLWRNVSSLVEQSRLDAAGVTTVTDDGRQVSFEASAAIPYVINYSYFPSWQAAAGAKRVYRVTPDRLLVFADGPGTVTLTYGQTLTGKLSLAVTLLTVLLLAGLAWRQARRRQRS